MYDKPMINLSWLELKPNKIKGGNDEEFDAYYSRFENNPWYKHIPKCVFEQWIHAHHDNLHTIKNYAWMDFNKISFEITFLKNNDLSQLYIIDDHIALVEDLCKSETFSDLELFEDDLHQWQEQGTWKTPPIVLDINTLPKIPKYSDISINHEYQLVEGHTRYGYLLSLLKMSQKEGLNISDQHEVFLMKYNKRQIRELNKSL